jgi:hypothetical protein
LWPEHYNTTKIVSNYGGCSITPFLDLAVTISVIENLGVALILASDSSKIALPLSPARVPQVLLPLQ